MPQMAPFNPPQLRRENATIGSICITCRTSLLKVANHIILMVSNYGANRNQSETSQCDECQDEESKVELLGRLNYLRNIYVTHDGESERMPCVVNSSSLECLRRLVMLREMTVREHLLNWAGLTDMNYRSRSVELLAQMAKAKKDRQR